MWLVIRAWSLIALDVIVKDHIPIWTEHKISIIERFESSTYSSFSYKAFVF